MSDAKLIAALQRQASEAEVERLRLVEEGLRHIDRIADLEAQLSASHLAAQRMATEAVAEERERWAEERELLRDGLEQVLTDFGDPHPRNASLSGLRASNDCTAEMVMRVLGESAARGGK